MVWTRLLGDTARDPDRKADYVEHAFEERLYGQDGQSWPRLALSTYLYAKDGRPLSPLWKAPEGERGEGGVGWEISRKEAPGSSWASPIALPWELYDEMQEMLKRARIHSEPPLPTKDNVAGEPNDLRERAIAHGAKKRWVTAEGYTQIPENMLHDLKLEKSGAHLWFVRGPDAWEAWREDDLESLFSEDR